ncbi:MAG: ComEC/Rec2 family competence protein [Bacteroidales bacterium]|nr:ComEC/Rec2 family competence protein [Bacteroidales bacterium]
MTKNTPFYFASAKMIIPLILGSLICQNIILDDKTVAVINLCCIGIIIPLALFSRIIKKHCALLSFILPLIICFILGSCLQLRTNVPFYLADEYVFPETSLMKIVSDPEQKGENFRMKCILLDSVYTNIPHIYMYIKEDSTCSLKKGDIIITGNKIKTVKAPQNKNDFNFKRYCYRNGIGYSCYCKDGDYVTLKTKSQSPTSKIAKTRKYLLSVLKRYACNDTDYSIAGAIILGNNDLSPETRQSFSASGGIHVLCVSGLHVTTLFLLITLLLRPLGNGFISKYISPVIQLSILWFYAAITGFSPSVTRASLMISFIIISQLTGGDTNITNSLCGSALIMTMCNPDIIFNIGFQLSYTAVLGIIIFQPAISGISDKIHCRSRIITYLFKKAWGILSVSISVQLLLTPVLIHYFNTFSNYFLLTNLIVIPLTTIILYLGIMLLIIAPADIVILNNIIGVIFYKFIHIMEGAVKFIETIPHSVSIISNFAIAQVVIYLMAIVLIKISIGDGFSAKRVRFLMNILIISILVSFYQGITG